ncbi:hypothetical protein QVD17_33338 [Tagetes erecta]|uniref:RING-type domain-containing protein n=1 Tax=Tagetes erecta TaxID=13708 RepID=A0AAD8NKK3_TARER|nr:hypothetical protein QVD17_33338 [Tagetes erecta]
MNTGPPPLISYGTTTPPQLYNNNNGISHLHHSSSSSSSSSIIIIIIISSIILISAIIYILIRFFPTPSNHFNVNITENEHNHTISIQNNNDLEKLLNTLPLFTFSSLTGKIPAGDCSVCLSKFENTDQLRLLPFCCHAFHAQCIDVWLNSNQTCPLCRSTVNHTEADLLKKQYSFRIEIGSISQRRGSSELDRRSYSVGSFEYVIDDGYEIPVESTNRRAVSDSVDKESMVLEVSGENLEADIGVNGGSGRRNWLRDYLDRVSVSFSSRTVSFRGGSGRFFAGSSRRSESVVDFEESHGRIGEEISELFRWVSGV